jgi:CRP/FNR family transcriptional regulator, anaerobic regulatory protein
MAQIKPDTTVDAKFLPSGVSISISRNEGTGSISLSGVRTQIPSELRNILARGRQQLDARFSAAPPVILRSGETLRAPAGSAKPIYRLQTGWVCQHRELPDMRRAIIDVYLPGDVIGLDGSFGTRPIENAVALTAIEAKVIDAEGALRELMASQSSALYAAWLLGHRQRRADRLLTTVSCLDARGRVAIMLLDFYQRLRARKLIVGQTYNLPLTQQHIGSYLGITVVHVNRVLKSLRDDQIARLERNCVTILDLERLTLLARGASDTAVKLDSNPAASSEDRRSDNIDKLAAVAAE